MSITTIFIYIIYSTLLLIILEYINKNYNINKIHNIFISIVYIIIISIISKNIKNNIYLVLIIELLLKIFYYNNILEKQFFKNNNIIIDIISIFMGYIININFINKVDSILPNAKEFRIIVWIIIVMYIYNSLKNNINNNININKYITNNKKDEMTKEYIVIEYAKNKNKYYNLITPKYKELIPIIYSILIYENYNRPKMLRNIDNIIFKINYKERKLGIMQISSNKLITDEESINIAINKLEKIYLKTNNKKTNICNEILKKYLDSEDEYNKVIDIYNKIIEFDKK